MMSVIGLGSRLELMVDDYLIDRLDKAALKLHHPQPRPLAAAALVGGYATVIKDGDRYRAWYRATDPTYRGERYDGHPGVMTCHAESQDGREWNFPDLGLFEVNGSQANNVVLFETPACHTFAPFLDTRWGAAPDERFKALAGQPLRLRFVMKGADLVYGFVPETSLAGDYIPNRCY